MLWIQNFNIKENRMREFQKFIKENEKTMAEHAPKGWKYMGTYFYALLLGSYTGASFWECSIYSQKSYNNALSVIPANIVNEVYDSLAFVFITGEPKKINKALNSKFTRNRGWVSNSEETFVEPFRPESKRGRFQVDHFKDGVGLEQEFRTSRDLLFDLLKLQLGHNWKRLSSGIIITFDENIKGKGDYLQRNKPYLQELDRLINRFGSAINFTIPLLVIGLKERRA